MQAIDSPDGLFHDGNPATGAMGTIVSSVWLNAVQGELKHMVEGLGGTLDPARNDQISALLLEALGKRPTGDALTTELAKKLGKTEKAADSAALDGHPADYFARAADLAKAAGIPLLHPIWCPNRAAIPAGYGPADGQLLSRSLYPDAWAGIAAGNVPVATDAAWLATPTERGKFTAGDGATTFRLPDYNGKAAGSLGALFMRGDGALSAGVDGAIQRDGVGSVDVPTSTNMYSGSMAPYYWSSKTRLSAAIIESGALGWHGAYSDSLTGQTSARTNSINMGSTDTRPLNVTGCWVIRLFGAVTNPGAADAAQLATEVAKLQSDKVPFTAFQGANQSITPTSGSQKLPGQPGMIIQWGGATNGQTITFPMAFNPACTPRVVFGSSGGGQSYYSAISNTQFTHANSSGNSASWIATGY